MDSDSNDMNWIRATMRTLPVACMIVVGLLASACDTSAPSARIISPTAAPVLPNIQQLSLGDFQASSLLPMAHGLLLFGTPGSVGQPNDAPPGEYAHPTTLYYYDFATESLRRLIAISPKSGVSITLVATGGDWVAFSTSTYITTYGDLWAINAVTHELRAIARSSDPAGGLDGFATDGKLLVWATSAGNQHTLHSYDLGTRQTQEFLKVTDPPLLQQFLVPVAVAQGAILYSQHFINNTTLNKDPRVGMYLLKSSSSSPERVGPVFSVNARMIRSYVVWDDNYNEDLGLYDRQTGKETTAWEVNCIHPDIAANGTYVACLDFSHKLAVVIQVPTGKRTILGSTVDYLNGTIVNNHVYWIVRKGKTPFSNEIDAWPLPVE